MKFIAQRTGRHCLSLPSNRLGLYLALRHWCRPGQRLLMSPISADEILFLVLAAGLRPVIAPVSARDGNIDVSLADLDGVDAVLTTNLYGLPDDVRAFTGKVLIEDVAHAMGTNVDGRPLGTFGQAGVFSLSKHPGAGAGGVLAVEHESDLRALTRARDALLTRGSLRVDVVSVATSMARLAALRLDLVRPALTLARALHLQEEREGYRIPLNPDRLEQALEQAPALPPFDPWVRADLHAYRRRRGRLVHWYQAERMAEVPADHDRRLAGVRSLAELPTVAPAVLDDLDRPLFRVPLLVRDRDAARAELVRHGVAVGYLYDPPYDDYAPGFAEPSPHPEPARWWARHVLPVDPVYAARALPVLRRLKPPTEPPPGSWRPAA
ncbi:DegT/DnrJ/EryC1/StrS family aminotransferase [Nonomuraea jiangxiensis]|uniref:dTDP-4-amino-4,6-dideoxygalactose transaminase n=1 Tax=Nonomuraea jiangxiensis TaxID=633440 RepID=A0A1G9A963_9ACTN|nr:DegT/DnrJ/EryC1/StrS family aminotransferase [Nonomuraea jiangxiensis]SDK23803.1 dTDP-4-amino-4,6-dideoxygalactose transaminase [Nonomuraea jiangxiensis]